MAGYNPDIAQLDEGYSLEFSPLLSLDGNLVDAVIRLQLNQIEQMVPVSSSTTFAAASRQCAGWRSRQMITTRPARTVSLALPWSLGVVADTDLTW